MSQIAWRHWQEPRLEARSGRRWMLAATLLRACFLVFALSTVHSTTAREPYMRVLPLPWLLPTAAWEHGDLMRFMRGPGLVGAFLGIAAVAAALFRRRPAGPWSTSWLLIAAVGTTLLGLHVSYVQLNDTYFVGLLPFAWLALAGLLGESRIDEAGGSLPPGVHSPQAVQILARLLPRPADAEPCHAPK